jgi:hypothetical protein
MTVGELRAALQAVPTDLRVGVITVEWWAAGPRGSEETFSEVVGVLLRDAREGKLILDTKTPD